MLNVQQEQENCEGKSGVDRATAGLVDLPHQSLLGIREAGVVALGALVGEVDDRQEEDVETDEDQGIDDPLRAPEQERVEK